MEHICNTDVMQSVCNLYLMLISPP